MQPTALTPSAPTSIGVYRPPMRAVSHDGAAIRRPIEYHLEEGAEHAYDTITMATLALAYAIYSRTSCDDEEISTL